MDHETLFKAVSTGLITYAAIFSVKRILTSEKVARFVSKTKSRWDNIVVFTAGKTSQFFLLATSVYAGSSHLPRYKYTDQIYFVISMIQVSIWSYSLMELWLDNQLTRKTRNNPAIANSMSLLKLLGRFFLFSVILLFTLSNLGVKITTIVAGLGVGGVAVALALQKILGDLFSSLSIVLDKPFMVGDFIVVDTYLGEVQKIGLKTTRLKSLSGEQLIFSNSDLLGARIRNYKRMKERRVVLNFHIPLHTQTEKVRAAIKIIQETISRRERIRLDRSHLARIGQFSLEIETVYWVLNEDYNFHMDLQQEILFEIKQSFEALNLNFTYPTQSIEVLTPEIMKKFSGVMEKERPSSLSS